MIKLAHFLRAGCTVKILLADIHGFLDNLKAPIELVKFRAEYYRFIIISLLKSVGVPIDNLEFVLGSSYQLSEKYTMDLFRLSSVVTEHDSKKAGAEVVKQVSNPTLSGLLYPLMQALDEEHLGVDAQFGGVDQRKIFTLAAEQLPKIGYKERAHLMNPMVPGLQGGKMSSSEPDSKIDLLDEPELTKRKLKKAPAAPREVDGNGIISFVEYVLLPVSALKNGGKANFVVDQREGEPRSYQTIDSLKSDYKNDIVTLSPLILPPHHHQQPTTNPALAPTPIDHPTNPQTGRNHDPTLAPIPDPRRLPRLPRMAIPHPQSLPACARNQEEGQEGQGQGESTPWWWWCPGGESGHRRDAGEEEEGGGCGGKGGRRDDDERGARSGGDAGRQFGRRRKGGYRVGQGFGREGAGRVRRWWVVVVVVVVK